MTNEDMLNLIRDVQRHLANVRMTCDILERHIGIAAMAGRVAAKEVKQEPETKNQAEARKLLDDTIRRIGRMR